LSLLHSGMHSRCSVALPHLCSSTGAWVLKLIAFCSAGQSFSFLHGGQSKIHLTRWPDGPRDSVLGTSDDTRIVQAPTLPVAWGPH
jgi:hypothetical protein